MIRKMIERSKVLIKRHGANPDLKQELLLRKALEERGLSTDKLTIKSDHDKGFSYVNGIKLRIKFPESFLRNAEKLITENKTISFYFNGFMPESGNRKEMLKPFENFDNTLIISSLDGRVVENKNQFNHDYFAKLSQAKFGLCPHQSDWPGRKSFMWTYRFIEACFVNAIPVIFRAAPLGKQFLTGFHYLWDDEIISSGGVPGYDKIKAEENKALAIRRFTLTDDQYNQIKATL